MILDFKRRERILSFSQFHYVQIYVVDHPSLPKSIPQQLKAFVIGLDITSHTLQICFFSFVDDFEGDNMGLVSKSDFSGTKACLYPISGTLT